MLHPFGMRLISNEQHPVHIAQLEGYKRVACLLRAQCLIALQGLAMAFVTQFFKWVIESGQEDPEDRREAARQYLRDREEKAEF